MGVAVGGRGQELRLCLVWVFGFGMRDAGFRSNNLGFNSIWLYLQVL